MKSHYFMAFLLNFLGGKPPLKFNIAPEKLPSQWERIVFQPPFLRVHVKLQGCIGPHKEKKRMEPQLWAPSSTRAVEGKPTAAGTEAVATGAGCAEATAGTVAGASTRSRMWQIKIAGWNIDHWFPILGSGQIEATNLDTLKLYDKSPKLDALIFFKKIPQHYHTFRVGGCNPSEKYWSNWIISIKWGWKSNMFSNHHLDVQDVFNPPKKKSGQIIYQIITISPIFSREIFWGPNISLPKFATFWGAPKLVGFRSTSSNRASSTGARERAGARGRPTPRARRPSGCQMDGS